MKPQCGAAQTYAITRARASALLLGGAAVCLTGTVRAQTGSTIRIGVIPVEAAAEPFYAQDMGFFAKAGLDADIQRIPSSPAIAAATVSNAVDVGYASVDSLAAIHGKNVPVVIIAPAAEYVSVETERTNGLVVPANSSIQKARDLNGKVFAVIGLLGITHTVARAWIDENGGDSSTVKFVEVPTSAMVAALAAGRIDAAWVSAPFFSEAENTGRVLAYGFDAISKHFLAAAWFTTAQWATDHPEIVSRFAQAIRETAVWANKNHAASALSLAKNLKIDPATVDPTSRVHYGERLEPALIQPFIALSAKYSGYATFPAQELVFALLYR